MTLLALSVKAKGLIEYCLIALNCRCGVSGKVAQDNLHIFGLIWRSGVRFGFVSSVPTLLQNSTKPQFPTLKHQIDDFFGRSIKLMLVNINCQVSLVFTKTVTIGLPAII